MRRAFQRRRNFIIRGRQAGISKEYTQGEEAAGPTTSSALLYCVAELLFAAKGAGGGRGRTRTDESLVHLHNYIGWDLQRLESSKLASQQNIQVSYVQLHVSEREADLSERIFYVTREIAFFPAMILTRL